MCIVILKSLEKNHSVEYLDLSHNSIQDWGLAFIDEVLESNLTLKVLDLSYNEVGPNVGAQLQKVGPLILHSKNLIWKICRWMAIARQT